MPWVDTATGQTWTVFDDRQLVVNESGVPQPGIVGQAYPVGASGGAAGTTPLPIRAATSGAPLGGLTTDAQGFLPAFMALMPPPMVQYRVVVDFPGDAVRGQIIKSDDIADLAASVSSAVAQAQAASTAASTAQTSAASSATAAELSRQAAVTAAAGSDGTVRTLAQDAHDKAVAAQSRADAAYALAAAGGGTTTPPPVIPPPTPGTGTQKGATPSNIATVLAGAVAGDVITLADGVYPKAIVLSRNGSATSRIVLQGSRNAIFDGGGTGSGYAFQVDRCNYWTFSGFTIRRAQKGLMADESNFCLYKNLEIHTTGHELFHLRNFSSDNVIDGCLLHDAGQTNEQYGEGVYFGQSETNWDATFSRTNGAADKSDRNQLLNTRVYNVTAETIDIKEGTTGGLIKGNTLEGQMASPTYADSYVDVKGNDYYLEDNTCINPSGFIAHGMETHILFAGYGNRNVFRRNNVTVNGTGFGFNIQESGSRGTAVGNRVESTNIAIGAASGLTNIGTSSPTTGGGPIPGGGMNPPDGGGTTTPPPVTGPANPGVLLNIGTAAGKNAYVWQAPVDTAHPGSPDQYTVAEVADGYTADWFKLNAAKTGVLFKAQVDGATTSPTAFPSSEMWEATAWNGTVGSHSLELPSFQVLRVPSTRGVVAVMRIHDGTTGWLAVNTQIISGVVKMVCRLNGTNLTPRILESGVVGVTFGARIALVDGTARVYWGGSGTAMFTVAVPADKTNLQFRWGAYVQSNATQEIAPNEYGEVLVSTAPVTSHTVPGGTPSLDTYGDIY